MPQSSCIIDMALSQPSPERTASKCNWFLVNISTPRSCKNLSHSVPQPLQVRNVDAAADVDVDATADADVDADADADVDDCAAAGCPLGQS